MKVAVLGAAGRMGKWFVRYFVGKGYAVSVSDIKRDELETLSKNYGVKIARDNLEAVRDAELVVVSVPLNKTAEILLETIPNMKKGSIILEIASLKSGIVNVLKESSKFSVKAISLHPLFGPLWKMRERFALIPVLNAKKELATARKLFPNAQIIVVDAEKHDRLMAITLSLTYFVNTALALTIKDEDFKALKKLSGTTFKLQQILLGSIAMQKSDFHVYLHMTNKYALQYLEKFVSNARRLKKLIHCRDAESFKNVCGEIGRNLSKHLDLAEMYEKMYTILEVVESERSEPRSVKAMRISDVK
ncbi:MAG: prephenate dehydrogenase/arogenate dehydrogenase family protein [Candidatus Bathyarchaeia archaeon]